MLCLLYLDFLRFAEAYSDDQRAKSADKGCFAFQDYAVAHWADHVLAVTNRAGPKGAIQDPALGEEDLMLDAFLYFGLRYQADLAIS